MSEPKTMKKFPLYMPMGTYLQIKAIADYKGLPVTRVIISILNGYLRSRKARLAKYDKNI